MLTSFALNVIAITPSSTTHTQSSTHPHIRKEGGGGEGGLLLIGFPLSVTAVIPSNTTHTQSSTHTHTHTVKHTHIRSRWEGRLLLTNFALDGTAVIPSSTTHTHTH